MSHDPDHRIMYSRTEALNIMREREEADNARRLRLRAETQLEEEHLARMERIRSGEYTRSRVPSSDLSTSEDDPLIPGMTQSPKKDSVKKEEDYGEDHAAREKAREMKRDHDNAVKKWSAKKREVSMFEKLEDDVKFPKWHKDFRATAKSLDLMFVLNPKYDPKRDHERLGMPTIFKDANPLVYDVLLKTVKPRRAKKIVQKYEFDGQRAYGELMEYYKGKSAHAANTVISKCDP